MSLTQAITTFLQKYVDFKGRASRSEYWWVALAFFIITLPSTFVDIAAIVETGEPTLSDPTNLTGYDGIALLLALIYLLIGLATFLPSLALTVRRLHDTGKSAWFLLMVLIPFAGPIILLVFFLLPSDKGDNVYGAPPAHLLTI